MTLVMRSSELLRSVVVMTFFSHGVAFCIAFAPGVRAGRSSDLTRRSGRAEPCRGAFSELRSFRRGWRGRHLLSFSSSIFDAFLIDFGAILDPF